MTNRSSAAERTQWLISHVATPSGLLLATVPFWAAIVCILIFAESLTDFAGTLSICAAVIGFLFNSAVKFYTDMRDYTFETMKDARDDATLVRSFRTLGLHLSDRGTIKADDAQEIIEVALRHPEPTPHRELYEAVVYVGNFFERLYVATRWRIVLDEMLREYYDGMLTRYIAAAEPFITVIRNSPPRPRSPFGSVERPQTMTGVYALRRRWDWLGGRH